MNIEFTYIPLGTRVSIDDKHVGTIEHEEPFGYWFEDENLNKVSPYFTSEDDCRLFIKDKFLKNKISNNKTTRRRTITKFCFFLELDNQRKFGFHRVYQEAQYLHVDESHSEWEWFDITWGKSK